MLPIDEAKRPRDRAGRDGLCGGAAVRTRMARPRLARFRVALTRTVSAWLLALGGVVVVGSAGVPASASAQTLAGRVLMAGWREPVPGAQVELLSESLQPVAQRESLDDGRFSFSDLEPGRYHLRASVDGTDSELVGPLDLRAGEERSLVVTLPSVLYERAGTCTKPTATTGVLAGIAHDVQTGTPLPGALVVAEWEGERREAVSDGAGRFVLCAVPASEPLTVWVEVLGRKGRRSEGLRVEPAALARFDAGLDLSRASSVRVVDMAPSLRADSMSTLVGRLLDADSDRPIAGASVQVAGLESITNQDGGFRFAQVAPGRYAFQVRRLGYDWISSPVDVAGGATVVLELRAAPEAVELDALVVRATTVESRLARAATQAPRIIAGDRLRMAERRAATVRDVLRELPSLQFEEGRFETDEGIQRGVCIESSRALQRYAVPEKQTPLPWCEMIAVVVDGISVSRGAELISTLRVWSIESIEFLPPTGALRWGERAARNGAIVIWTRGRGPHASRERGSGR